MSSNIGPAVGFAENLDADDIFEANRTEAEFTHVPRLNAVLYDDGVPWIKVEKMGGGTIGRRYEGHWLVQIWVRGEIVYQGTLFTGSTHTHLAAAEAAWEMFIANDAPDMENLSDLLYPNTSRTHGEILGTGDGDHCLKCGAQGAPLKGRCPGEQNLIHGQGAVEAHILDDCPAYQRWGTCRHTVHSCECEMCQHGQVGS